MYIITKSFYQLPHLLLDILTATTAAYRSDSDSSSLICVLNSEHCQISTSKMKPNYVWNYRIDGANFSNYSTNISNLFIQLLIKMIFTSWISDWWTKKKLQSIIFGAKFIFRLSSKDFKPIPIMIWINMALDRLKIRSISPQYIYILFLFVIVMFCNANLSQNRKYPTVHMLRNTHK